MRSYFLFPWLGVVLAAAFFAVSPAGQTPQTRTARFDVLIANGRIVDGTGAPWFRGDIGIVGDRIAAIGALGERHGRHDDRCDQSRRLARLHRPAGPVGVQPSGRRPRREQDPPGHHHRGDGRRVFDRAGERPHDPGGVGERDALRRRAGLAHAGRLLQADRGAVADDRQRRHLRRRRRDSQLRDREGRSPGDRRRARADEAARRRRRWSRGRSASARRCSTCRTGSRPPTRSSSSRRWRRATAASTSPISGPRASASSNRSTRCSRSRSGRAFPPRSGT